MKYLLRIIKMSRILQIDFWEKQWEMLYLELSYALENVARKYDRGILKEKLYIVLRMKWTQGLRICVVKDSTGDGNLKMYPKIKYIMKKRVQYKINRFSIKTLDLYLHIIAILLILFHSGIEVKYLLRTSTIITLTFIIIKFNMFTHHIRIKCVIVNWIILHLF